MSIGKEKYAAEKDLADAIEKVRVCHCPVIDRACIKTRCMSWSVGSLIWVGKMLDKDIYSAGFVGCRNPAITGQLEVEGDFNN